MRWVMLEFQVSGFAHKLHCTLLSVLFVGRFRVGVLVGTSMFSLSVGIWLSITVPKKRFMSHWRPQCNMLVFRIKPFC